MLIFKTFISRNFLFVLFTVSLLGTSVGFAQDCKAELKVEHDFTTKSAFEDGAFFPITVTNTSSFKQEFILTSVSLKEPCSPKRETSKLGNVILDVSFISSNKSSAPMQTRFELAAGETFNFNVQVKVPKGTPFYRWSCIEVQVQSVKCNSIVATEILKVYVPNPSEQ